MIVGKPIQIRSECSQTGIPENEIRQMDFLEGTQNVLNQYAGKIQTVYLDPPFFTGKGFKRKARMASGDGKPGDKMSITAYKDSWESRDAYNAMMEKALYFARELLAETGTIFLHVDYRASAHMRLLLDRVFGEDQFINEIIWIYQSGGRSVKTFPRKHDTILFYGRSQKYFFDLKAVPCGKREDSSNHMRRQVDEQGREYRSIMSGGKEYRYYMDEDVYPSDVWQDISHLQQRDPERTGMDTQKPTALLRRIIGSTTRRGDLVCDFFCGSGTTGVAAVQMGRRFLLMDREPMAVGLAASRLSLENCCWRLLSETTVDDATLMMNVSSDGSECILSIASFEKPAADGSQDLRQMLESWSVGFFENDEYVRTAAEINRGGIMRFELPCPKEPRVAVMLTDLCGTRRCYELEL